MKKLAFAAALLGAFTLPGCIVAVESRSHRVVHDPPPVHDHEPEVVVEWTSARTVVLREYYDCDWDTVGYFDYYERDCGIPEDDLFFLLHVSRTCGRPFGEVVFTYSACNRQLYGVVQHYRINHWDLYVDLPVGTACPPAYQRVYGYYWNRHRHPVVVYTNYDFHALFWLRFGTHYYGWQPRDCFTRWDNCVDTRVRFTTVIHREYQRPGRRVGQNWANHPVRVIDKRERDVRVIEKHRTEVYKKVEVECDERSKRGEKVVHRLPPQERDRHVNEQKRQWEDERKREVEIRRREPQKFEEYKRHDDNRKREDVKTDRRDDDRKDDRKDERDDRKDDRRDPPKNEPRKNEPKKDEPKKNEPKKEEPKKDGGHDEKKAPPPEKKNPPKEEKKDEKKPDNRKDEREDRRDDRRDDRDDRRDDRKKDDGKKDDGKKDDGKKDDGKKDDGKKDNGKKDDGKKNDGGKKDEGKKDGGKKQSPPRQPEPPQRQQRAPERKQPEQKQKQEQKRQERKPQDDQKQDGRKQDRRR